MNEQSNKELVKIGKENYYSFTVDTAINRLTIEFLGVWASPDDVPNYLSDLDKALSKITRGYTLLTLIEDKKPPKLAITKLHKGAMQACMDAGYVKCAIVLKSGKMLQTLSTNVIGKLAGFNFKTFAAEQEAVKWLDEKAG
jgi:hypothetical protein